jgi:microcystin-dependent protein
VFILLETNNIHSISKNLNLNIMEPVFMAEIIIFAGNFAPRGWAFCQGQILPISSNTALFSILGTTYGGDGRTTFGLPDLRSRVAIQQGQGPGLSHHNLGAKGGVEHVTLQPNQIPSHNHTINAVIAAGNQNSPTNHLLADTSAFDKEYSDANPDTTMKSSMVGNTGGSQSHTNIQPYLAINYIIALEGPYPSRS